MGSILEGLGSFLGVFLGFDGSLFRGVRRSGKCGLDSLFAMNQAHGHLPTQTEKVIKYANFGGRFLGRHFGAFLASFWLRFGTILGTKWPKKAIQKSTGKKGPEKVMRVFAGVCEPWGCCPLKTIQLDSWGII